MRAFTERLKGELALKEIVSMTVYSPLKLQGKGKGVFTIPILDV